VLSTIQGRIRWRVLINYRVEPSVMRPLVPGGFHLTVIDGWAIAGICLIRQEGMHPAWMPGDWGPSTDSAAYRVAVDGAEGPAVYVARRDTSSRLQAGLGGRLFPAAFGHARFAVREDGATFDLDVTSADGQGDVRIRARTAAALPATSVFPDLPAASGFFEVGSLGWSPRSGAGGFDCVELRTQAWNVTPLELDEVVSSYYDDPSRFPPGSMAFDSALIMRDVRHEWYAVTSSIPCNHAQGVEPVSEKVDPPVGANRQL
jgi:hypothetical protein